MKKISRKGFLKVAAAAAMSGVTASALAACNAGSSSSTAASTGEAIYTPGTYTGTATGIGEVKVTMTFSETAITDVVIDASNETESIGGVAAPTLKDALMAAQSTEIDNISGATITTNAVKKAAASCIEQAMGVHTAGGDTAASSSDEDWLGTEPEIDESKVAKTVDVDVAVVGCGIAGVAACRSVAEDGGLVAAFEKADGPQCRSGEYAVINGKVQAKWGRDTWTREQIDDIIDSHMVESTYRCKRSIMSKWAHNIGDAFDWWVEANPDLYYAETTRSAIPDENANNFLIPIFYPLPENYDWKQERFPCYPTSVEFLPNQSVTVNANMQKAVDTGNVDTFYGCFVEKLIMEDGRCVGLYARDAATGEYIKCNAAKGVILSTGGYGNNLEMMEARQPWNQKMRISIGRNGTGGNPTGDGIKAALWAGGQMDPIGAACMFNRAAVKPDEKAGDGIVGEWFWFGEQPFMKVNLNGNRFCNESGPYDYMLHSTVMQPGHTYCDIFDSDYVEQVKQMNEVGCCRLYPFDNGSPSNMSINLMPKMFFDPLLEKGYLQKADTPEELAQKLNIPVDNFVETFNRYNQMAENGKDEDYNKEPYRLMPLKTPPYYGIRTGAWFLATLDGVRIDTNMHPFREDGSEIEGLYMAGDCSGGFFSTSYPNLFTGLACGRTMVEGRRAGMLAATGQA